MTEILPRAGEGRGVVCDHLVQVYRNQVELAEAVAVFFSTGLEAGEAIVSVSIPAHWVAISDLLEKRGHDFGLLQAEGRVVVAHAGTTLAAVSEDAAPSQPLFRSVVGDLLDRAAGGSPGRPVRVFGEMVDILSRRGDRAGAETLEGYWNQLRRERRFELLCAYKVDLFDRDIQVNLLPQVYRAHSDVVPLRAADALDEAVGRAVAAVLGPGDAQKVRAQIRRHVQDERLSEGQRTLMWVSANMPRAAEAILAAARAEYLDASESAAA